MIISCVCCRRRGRVAIDFVNDSFFTTLWLEYDAPTIALGPPPPSLREYEKLS